ncbi:hypothetical protein HW115_12645 [Verrucomicrobiaceae bacterium N1E253]|uniref:Uncharacterized protein n=1 Tax=Oceaniferula marina TaxID=2748318 RepID=A0A851GG21_9BACT|nr:hypothetical protein [Oceaniferula marina]
MLIDDGLLAPRINQAEESAVVINQAEATNKNPHNAHQSPQQAVGRSPIEYD